LTLRRRSTSFLRSVKESKARKPRARVTVAVNNKRAQPAKPNCVSDGSPAGVAHLLTHRAANVSACCLLNPRHPVNVRLVGFAITSSACCTKDRQLNAATSVIAGFDPTHTKAAQAGSVNLAPMTCPDAPVTPRSICQGPRVEAFNHTKTNQRAVLLNGRLE
jgi:hypothetical protein